MANKKISELESRASLSLSDLMAVGDPSTGYLYKTTISDLKTLTGAGVVSFNGRFGTVNPAEGDYTLTQLGDVIITSATNGQVLQYNGSNWVNTTLPADNDTLDIVTGRGNTTANSITVGSVTAAGLSNLLGQIRTFATTGNTYIGTNPGSATDAGYKLDVNGFIRASQLATGAHSFRNEMYITSTTDGYTKQNSYNAASAFTMGFIGDLRFASSTAIKSVFSFNGAYSNNGTVYSGDVSLMKIFTSDALGNPTPSANINGYGINLMPTLNYTQSTSNFTGIYYNPTLTATTGLTHYAMNLVAGLVRMGTLAGTGSRMVVADANGVLSAQAIPDLSGYVTLDSFQTITASKTFSVGFSLASAGGSNQITSFANTNSIHSGSGGSNIFGFNNSNNIYFGKGLSNGGVIAWNNSTVRTYTLPNADGTLALTSDIPSLTGYVQGSGTTNTLPKFTGASTIGNSNVTDTGSLITLGSNSYVNGNLGVGITASSTWGRTGFEIGISGASLTREVRDLVLLSNSIWTSTGLVYVANAGAGRFDVGVSSFRWYTAPSGTAGNAITFTQAMTLFNTGNLALNTTTDAGFRLDVNGTARVSGQLTANSFVPTSSTIPTNGMYLSGTNTLGFATNSTLDMVINERGDLGLGATPSAWSAFRALQVGTASVSQIGNRAYLTANAFFNGTNWVYIASDFATQYFQQNGTHIWNTAPTGTASNTFTWTEAMHLSANGSLGIGTNSLTGITLSVSKNITGATTAFGVNVNGVIQSDVTLNTYLYTSTASTQATSFATNGIRHFYSRQGTFGAGSSVFEQFGFYADSNLIGATTNYGFFGNIPAAANRWNLYMNGTANNYMAGKLLIGTTSDNGALLQVQGSATISSTLTTSGSVIINPTTAANSFIRMSYSSTNFGLIGSGAVVGGSANTLALYVYGNNPLGIYTNNIERVRISGTGNLLVGTTTDGGFLLDVNGTARVQGAVTAAGITSTGTNTMISASSSTAGLVVRGGSSIGTASLSSGQIFVGQTTSYRMSLAYDDNTGYMYIDNLYDNVNSNIYIRTRTNGTPINALTILGTGAATFVGDVKVKTLEVTNVGTNSTSSGVSTYMQITVNGQNYLIPLHGTP